MGGFYGSVQVKTEDAGRVVAVAEEVAREKGIKCLVGPALKGWVGIYPENGGQDQTVGEAVARKVGGVVLQAIVHDDDVMAYWLWREGELVDSYWSSPGYFGEEQRAEQEKMKGDARVVAEVCGVEEKRVREVLEGEGGTFESDRLERFGRVIGMKNLVTSYEYLQEAKGEGVAAGVTGMKKFREVPNDAVLAEKEARKRERAEVAAHKKLLKKEGSLLTEMEWGEMASVELCAARRGFLVAHASRWNTGSAALQHIGRDFTEGLPWEAQNVIYSLTSDRAGRFCAIGAHEKSMVMEVESGEIVREFLGEEKCLSPRLSGDGERLAYLTDGEIVVENLRGRERLLAVPRNEVGMLVLDESGDWLMVTEDHRRYVKLFEVATQQLRRLVDGSVVGSEGPCADLVEAVTRMDLEALEQQHQKSMEELRTQFAESATEQFERVRARFEIEWAKTKAEWEKIRAGISSGRGVQIFSAGRSRDGGSMWLCTDIGLRVFSFQDVIDNQLAMPRWEFRPPDPTGNSRHYVYSAIDVGGGMLAFSGSDGAIWCAPMSGGIAKELVTFPEKSAIWNLEVSGDGGLLASLSQRTFDRFKGRRRERTRDVHVWDLKKLMKRAGVG